MAAPKLYAAGAAYGDGVSLSKTYDAPTGHLTGIMSTNAAAGTIRNLSYQFITDASGNVLYGERSAPFRSGFIFLPPPRVRVHSG